MRPLALLVLLAAACSDGNQLPGTPTGTVLVAWKPAADDFMMKKATIGARRDRETRVVVEIGDRHVKLDVHVETAHLTRTYGSATREFDTPVLVDVKVADSDDMTLDPGGCGRLEPQGEAELMLVCSFGARRKTRSSSYEGGGELVVCADGQAAELHPGVISSSCPR